MGLLKRTEHDNLLDLLRAIPDYDDQQSRRLLKRKLPSEILDNIEDDGAPAIHLKNILRVVDTDLEYPSDNGIWPILTLVENAKIWAERFHFSPGINHVIDELNTLHKNLQERAIQHIPEISDHITSALVSAFPTRRKLELFALFSLNWNLENFYGNNLLELTTNLVNFAIKEKRLIFLIDAAMNASPHDPYIRAVAVAAHRCDPIDPPLPGEKLDGLQIQQLSIALAGAFIYQELRDITQLVLKKKLEEISLREELIDVAVDLVLASERYDVTYDLIKEALKERPINQVFLWFIGKSQSNFSKKPKRIEVRSAYSHDTIIEFKNTLTRAFSLSELKYIVIRTFGREIDIISLANSRAAIVLDLVLWAMENNVMEDLVESARFLRPSEQFFEQFSSNSSLVSYANSTRTDQVVNNIDFSRSCSSSLRDVLVKTFSYTELRQIFESTFGLDVEEIIIGNTLGEVVQELVLWTYRNSNTILLFESALRSKPQNPILLSWASNCLSN